MRMTEHKWSMTFKKSLNELMLRLNKHDWTEITTTTRVLKKQTAVVGEDSHSDKESGNKFWVGFILKIHFCEK